jgi:Activator of mitotic machinery Cdc14 phosphatase activation C-term
MRLLQYRTLLFHLSSFGPSRITLTLCWSRPHVRSPCCGIDSLGKPSLTYLLLQTSARVRDTGASFATRKGHIPQISINDDDHHVTEAIGYMYGEATDQDAMDYTRTSSGYQGSDSTIPADTPENKNLNSIPRKRLPERSIANGDATLRPNGKVKSQMDREYSWEQPQDSSSPPLEMRGRSPSETATAQFPLNDIDYESSPAAVAQELSNLQALRRMSMDVAAQGDPDLPTLNPAAMPTSPSLSEDDDSRLFWVPARLHPELAPKEFKSFLDSKAEQIRRRSGELSAFSSQSSTRTGLLTVGDSSGGLRRKKSMLSRQIDNSAGYQDGAERLERKKSLSKRTGPSDPNLQELEFLVAENPILQRSNSEVASEETNGDIILPSIPGSSLKRSTRTTYKRGGSVNGRTERLPYAQRAARRAAAAAAGEEPSPPTPQITVAPPVPVFSPSEISQTPRDPLAASGTTKSAPNFSRPAPPESTPRASMSSNFESLFTRDDASSRSSISSVPEARSWTSQSSLQGRPSLNLPTDRQPIPQIIEVPPPEEPQVQIRSSSVPAPMPQHQPQPQQMRLPERTSSREDPPRVKTPSPQRPPIPPKQPTPSKRPPSRGNAIPPPQRSQTLDQMSSHPSPLPGNDTNTGSLSFIPTLTEDKRADNKKIKDKKEESKKSGWSWLLGKEEAEKDKSRVKSTKAPEKHDNTRLDVLQTSIEGSGKGRESFVMDRESLKLDEERKKESQRKSSGSDSKKEKENIFSSIFGGKKNKLEKESAKKHHPRGLSPEPPYRVLRPDIDYNWTRFSILEERAIYRMAHMKLANPRRALHSQVLLSNFMYSYLAKVQQMHPQMNLPTSAKQQKKQQQSAKEQPDEYTQYQRYQQVRDYNMSAK